MYQQNVPSACSEYIKLTVQCFIRKLHLCWLKEEMVLISRNSFLVSCSGKIFPSSNFIHQFWRLLGGMIEIRLKILRKILSYSNSSSFVNSKNKTSSVLLD